MSEPHDRQVEGSEPELLIGFSASSETEGGTGIEVDASVSNNSPQTQNLLDDALPDSTSAAGFTDDQLQPTAPPQSSDLLDLGSDSFLNQPSDDVSDLKFNPSQQLSEKGIFAEEREEEEPEEEVVETETPPSPPPSPVNEEISAPQSAPVPLVAADSTTPSSSERPIKVPPAVINSAPAGHRENSTNLGASECVSIDPRVWDILLWKKPVVTGSLLAAELFVLISLSQCSVFSVLSYTLLLTLIVTFGARVFKYVVGKVHSGDEAHPFQEILDLELNLDPATVTAHIQSRLGSLNTLVTQLRDLIFIKDVLASLKFSIVVYASTYIGAWFNGLTLLILVVTGLFTLPKVYVVNKTQIDQHIETAQAKVMDVYHQLQEKVPYLKKQKAE